MRRRFRNLEQSPDSDKFPDNMLQNSWAYHSSLKLLRATIKTFRNVNPFFPPILKSIRKTLMKLTFHPQGDVSHNIVGIRTRYAN